VGKLPWDITTTQVNLALHPTGVTKSSTSFGWGKDGKVTAACGKKHVFYAYDNSKSVSKQVREIICSCSKTLQLKLSWRPYVKDQMQRFFIC